MLFYCGNILISFHIISPSIQVADGTHMPVGHYGNGFKSGSMRLGKDALVLTKQRYTRSIGYLSQTYLEAIKAETVVVPIATWDHTDLDDILLNYCLC